MSGFFSTDNKIFGIFSKTFDLMVLGIIWLLLCAPIITIGPASTALYYTIVKVVRRERSYLLKEFWHSFKTNFLQGALISLIYAVFGGILYVDFTWANQLAEDSKYNSILMGAFIAIAIFAVFTAIYIFPLLSRFTQKTGALFRWAFLLSVRHIVSTLLMVLCLAAVLVLAYYSYITQVAAPLLLVLPSLYSLLMSFPMEKIMKKYMPKQEEGEEDDGVDRWYNE